MCHRTTTDSKAKPVSKAQAARAPLLLDSWRTAQMLPAMLQGWARCMLCINSRSVNTATWKVMVPHSMFHRPKNSCD
jgi:hypothetical protein